MAIIKNLFTPSWQLEAQELIMHIHSRKLEVSEKQLSSAIKSFFNQHMRIINDSSKICNTTTNPKIFFSRFSTMLEHCDELCKLEHIRPKIFTKSIITQTAKARANYSASIDDLIDRCWKETKQKAASLKTDKAKLNRYNSFFDVMELYCDEMKQQNINHINALRSSIN